MRLSAFIPRKSCFYARLPGFLLVAIGSICAFAYNQGNRLPQDQCAKKETRTFPEPGWVEVRFTDDSNLKLALKIERVDLHTPYGKLQITIADIRRIEFATRIPVDVAARVDAAVAHLGNNQYRVREAATIELKRLSE